MQRTRAWARTIEALPPALRYRLQTAVTQLQGASGAQDSAVRARLERLLVEGEAWLGAEPVLAELGYWMIEPRHPAELRALGCRWLAQFPSVEMARRLAALAIDEAVPVREQAIRALGDRQLRGRHPAAQWPAEAIALADEALVRIATEATARGRIASAALPVALRHVASDGLAAVLARAPGLWGEALECFASPPLARVLAVSIGDIPPQHRLRVVRLVAATLGEEALPVLLARVARSSPVEQLEILFLAVTLGGEPQLGRLDEMIRRAPRSEHLRARARWHLQHRGVIPTVRGLRIARTTAVIDAGERAARCGQAADDLAALTRYERHAEGYVYTLWGWMVRGAADPARARELGAAHPHARGLVRELYLEDLARRGRVKQLTAAARELGAVPQGALQLAIWGRPLAALELAAAEAEHTAELVCARALASYRAGRPDLARRLLADDPPAAELTDGDALRPFPGPHEQWLVERGYARPALAALVGGRAAVLALAQPAPHDAEPDAASIAPLLALAHRLSGSLAGATVYIAGELAPPRRAALTTQIAAAGGRLVAGPVPGLDYYVRGDGCSAHALAELERRGARRLPDRYAVAPELVSAAVTPDATARAASEQVSAAPDATLVTTRAAPEAASGAAPDATLVSTRAAPESAGDAAPDPGEERAAPPPSARVLPEAVG